MDGRLYATTGHFIVLKSDTVDNIYMTTYNFTFSDIVDHFYVSTLNSIDLKIATTVTDSLYRQTPLLTLLI